MIFHMHCFFTIYEFITNSQCYQLPDRVMAHLVEHRIGIVVAMGSNPVQAWKTSIYLHISFFRFFSFRC